MMKKCDTNVRGIDANLYRKFKSMVYSRGYRNVKECMTDLMNKFIKEDDTKTEKKNGVNYFDNLDFKTHQSQGN